MIKLPSLAHPIIVEPTEGRVTVRFGGRVVAESTRALTLCEASHPPVQYVPLADVDPRVLVASGRRTWCPYKGTATYFSLRAGDREAPDAVWTYRAPHAAVAPIEGHVAFYPDRVDGVVVEPEET